MTASSPAQELEGRLNERMTGLESRVTGAVSAIQDRFQKGSEFWTETRRDVDKLQVGNSERDAALEALRVRVVTLERDMDNLPSRVSNLEKYGSDVTIKLPETIKEQGERLKVLEDKPNEWRKRAVVWVGIGGCLYMSLSLFFTVLLGAIGVALSILLR